MRDRPNILLFMTDQEQGDVLDPAHPCQTPHAAALARDGVRFTNAYCPTAHCCPSRATFLTGLYPSRHGVRNNVSTPTALRRGLVPGVGTFGEALRGAGYRLLFAGKWHVSDEEDPADRGWEELLVTAGRGSDHHRSPQQWREQGPEPDGPRPRGCIRRPGWGDYQLYATAPAAGPLGYEGDPDWPVIRSALAGLADLARGDGPWCLYVGPRGPHDPWVAPEPFVRRYSAAAIPLPASFGDRLADKPRIYQRLREQVWGQLSDDEVRESIAHYWAMCTLQDTYLGLLLDALEDTGQREDTLVLRLSDHGELAGAHGLYLKGVPAFREGYQIACVASWPRGIAGGGRVVDDVVTLADIAPTLQELAGLPPSPGLSGRSLVPFLRDERPADWPDAFCSQLDGVELYYTQRAVRTREHAYVFNGFDMDELYDLRSDPHELVNVADRREYADVKRELVRRMWRFAEREGDHIFNPYPTVALAPWGPADALWPEATAALEEANRLLALSRQARWTFPTSFGTPVGADAGDWVGRLVAERDRFADAAATFLEYGDAEAAEEIAANVWRLWVLSRDLQGGRDFLAGILDRGPAPPSRARALALYGDGLLALRLGAREESRARNEAALDAARVAGDDEALALANLGLSRVALDDGDHRRAEAFAVAARAHVRSLGRAMGQAPLHMHAQAVRLAGDHERAAALFAESLALNRALGDVGMVDVELHNLGQTELRRGNVDAAERLFAEWTQMASPDDPYDAAMGALHRAAVALARGRRDDAAAELAQLESTLEAAGIELAGDDRREADWLHARLGAGTGDRAAPA